MPASIEILLRHGFPSGIVAALKADGVQELLDPQVEAVLRFHLLEAEDLLVSLPTSCGKTLIGELAGVGAALLGKRAVFSVPLKALAREKYELFQRRYASYGLRICLATGEFSDHLAALARGDYDIAVLIHEKFKHLAIREPALLRGIHVAVLDELQGIEDPSRGPDLEFLLGLLKRSSPRVRRVGLVGVLAPDDPLAEDFENRVLTARQRPIDLRQGIVLADRDLADKALTEYGLPPIETHEEGWISVYRSHNTAMVEAELLPVAAGEEGMEGDLLRLASGLAASGEPVLLFLPSRREAEQAALQLAESAPFLEDLGRLPEAEQLDDETLQFCLSEGIAFHHADCSPRCRALVEESFRAGFIRILCCTSTLAMGVNLPARNVLIHPFVWNRNGQSGELSLLPEAIVRNMAGRAGRLGLGEEHGRALLVARTEREWDLYRRCYWADLAPRLKAWLLAGDIGPYLLAGIALGQDSAARLEGLLASLISARCSAPTPIAQGVKDGLEQAVRQGLVESAPLHVSEQARFALTPLGRVAALRGLSFETVLFFSEWVAGFEGTAPPDLLSLMIAASVSEAQSWTWPRDRNPELRALWVERVREQLGWQSLRSLGGHWTDAEAVSPRFEDAAKMAWALLEWSKGEPLDALRQKAPGVTAGNLHAAGEGARWLLESLADVWQVRGQPAEGGDVLRALSQRVGSGLPEWALAWDIIPSELLDRDHKLALAKEISHPRGLLGIRPEDVSNLIPAFRYERIRMFVETLGIKPSDSSPFPALTPTPLPEMGEGRKRTSFVLDANLAEEGSRYRAMTWKQSVFLGMRSAELLLRLVRERKKGDSGWISKERLAIDPESLSQRISDLRTRLGPPPPGMAAWIESNRRGHYRIVCEADSIRWSPANTPREIEALLG
jgi:replicative superfamily II helicase